MKIQKVYQKMIDKAKIMTTKTESDLNTYSCNYINNLNNYSDEETIVGTWFGKPLYRKVIYVDTLPNNNSIIVNTNFDDISIINYTNIYGIANVKTRKYTTRNIPNVSTNNVLAGLQMETNDDGNIFIRSGVDYSGFYGYITIEYTKTTD